MRCKRVYVLCVCVCVCVCVCGATFINFQGYLIKRPIFMDQYSFFMLISYGFLDRKAVKVAIQ